MKKFLKASGVLFAGLILGLLLGFLVTAPRKVGISEVQISKQTIANDEVLVVDSVEHPPWAQQHLTSVEFDYDAKTISIVRFYVLFNPLLRQEIYSRWPIIIRNGVLPGDYSLRIWKGEGFETIGKVIVGEKTIDFQQVK
jgi:hypothetical protein